MACETTVNLGNGPDAAGADATAGLDAAGADASPGAEGGGTDGGTEAAPGTDASGADAADASGGPKGFFVTRATYFPDFGGIGKADFRCQSSANAAQLTGTWKAWIS